MEFNHIVNPKENPVNTVMTGSNVQNSSEKLSLTFEKDGDGNGVARVVDVGGGVSYKIETLLNGITVNPNGVSPVTDLGVTNEDELWLLVNTDKQPWTVYVHNFPWGGSSSSGLFPVRSNVANAYSNLSVPCISLVLGVPAGSSFGLTPPTTMQEAKSFAFPMPNTSIQFSNGSSELANVTIKVLRIWRKLR